MLDPLHIDVIMLFQCFVSSADGSSMCKFEGLEARPPLRAIYRDLWRVSYKRGCHTFARCVTRHFDYCTRLAIDVLQQVRVLFIDTYIFKWALAMMDPQCTISDCIS